MQLIELFQVGGFIMYPLLICSILIWVVAIEKTLFLNKFDREFRLLHQEARPLVEDQKFDEVRGLYKKANELIATPLVTLFDGLGLKQEQREERLNRKLSETRQGLRRFLWILGTIGSSAPFIGLFGTVVGIIKSFDDIAESGKSGFSVVAAGLSEALVATAAGILVAVVAVIFYNYFQNRVNNTNLEFRNKVEDLADYLKN